MLEKSNYIDLVDGRFKGTTRADLKTAFQSINSSATPDNLVIHFHGGLVDRIDAHNSATGYFKNSFEAGGGYPFFVIWNSDVRTSLTSNLVDILQDPVFHRLVKRILRAVLSKYAEQVNGGRGPGDELQLASLVDIPDDLEQLEAYASTYTFNRLPNEELPGDADVIRKDLENDDELIAAERAAAGEPDDTARAAGGKRTPSNIRQTIVQEIRAEHGAEPDGSRAGFISAAIIFARYGVRIFSAVLKRLLKGRDHGVYTTILEEIARTIYIDSLGAVVWSTMKNDTRDAFDGPEAGGSALIEEIASWWKPGRRVTLIGHSTGAIYIGYFLEAWAKKLPVEAQADVVFLAPACTFDFLYQFREAFERCARKVVLFGLSDGIESGYWEVPLYKGSLLYIVSGLFEPPEVDMPIVGMQRYYQGKSYKGDELMYVRDKLIDEKVWAVTIDGPAGRNCDAMKHGDFRNAHMLTSLTEIIRNGA